MGQTSDLGGQCYNRCLDGQMWIVSFKWYPSSSFARSGDTSCTKCQLNHFLIEVSPLCFPNSRINSIMKLD